MKKLSILTTVMAAAIILAGCGRDVPKDAKPAVDQAIREFGVPAKCLEIKDVKKAENEKDSFIAVAVCEIDGKKRSGDITVKYPNGKPAVEILGFGYPALAAIKNGTVKPMVDLALREFGVPAKCLEFKDVKKTENEEDSFTAVAVCEIDGEKRSGEITVKYQKGKPVVDILGFGYPALMLVKNGILKFDTSRTVGEALPANLDDLKWEVFVNRRNQIVVKAAGIWKSGGLSFNGHNPGWSNSVLPRPFTVVKPGNRVEAYFIINRNGSFSFGDGKIISAYKDLGYDEFPRDVVTPGELEINRLKGGFLSVLYN